jgi:glycosyltransferase involved in cell wall biosynthesis
MRYVWNMYHDYSEGAGRITRLLMPWLIKQLRQWDFQSAANVDVFVSNSATVAQRVGKFYRRRSAVIHPPVDVAAFSPSAEVGDFYLYVGQLVRYKRVDLAVEACNRLGRPLVIIGEGEDEARLRALAGPTVRFLGRAGFDALKRHYATCRALLFPGEEDFGIVPLEATASGRPVIAYRRGGATETIIEGETGLFFDDQTVDSLLEAMARFEAQESSFRVERMIEHASGFSRERFLREFSGFLERLPRPPLKPSDSESLRDQF